jgi:hypothetical protein
MGRFIWLVVVAIAFLGTKAARAETVELANGEVLRGTVISLDAKELKFKSESLGEVTIDRAKVSTIVLGSGRLPLNPLGPQPPALPTAANPALPPPGTTAEPPSLEGLLKQLQGAANNPQATKPSATPADPADLLKQLGEGKSPALEELQKNPLFAAPEVQGYLKTQLGGLMDGSITINDIRQEAIRARDETRAAVKDLGPDAETALAPYLGILDRFIRETEPKTPAAVAPSTNLPPPALPPR